MTTDYSQSYDGTAKQRLTQRIFFWWADHVLMQITRQEAMRGLVDFSRIDEMLDRVEGRIDHVICDHVTPLSAPLFLEVGKVTVKGSAEERLLAEEEAQLMQVSGLAEIP